MCVDIKIRKVCPLTFILKKYKNEKTFILPNAKMLKYISTVTHFILYKILTSLISDKGSFSFFRGCRSNTYLLLGHSRSGRVAVH